MNIFEIKLYLLINYLSWFKLDLANSMIMNVMVIILIIIIIIVFYLLLFNDRQLTTLLKLW